jgi:hypothetical protein
MKKFISIIAACIGALVLTAGIALPSASADPTNAPGPGPTVANQPPGAPSNPRDDWHMRSDAFPGVISEDPQDQ